MICLSTKPLRHLYHGFISIPQPFAEYQAVKGLLSEIEKPAKMTYLWMCLLFMDLEVFSSNDNEKALPSDCYMCWQPV